MITSSPFASEPIIPIVMEDLTLPTMRLYKTPKGNVYPSVTTQLGVLSKMGLDAWKQRVGEEAAERIKKAAAARGTRVHKLVDDYLNGVPSFMQKAFPTDVDMFLSIKRHLSETIDVVYGNEFPLYSDVLKCAGRIDLFARYQGKPAIVDFKTSSKQKKDEYITSYKFQATCYALMIKEIYGIDVEDFHILISCSDEGNLQVFSGKVQQYKKTVTEFFIEQYKAKNYTQDNLKDIFKRGLNGN